MPKITSPVLCSIAFQPHRVLRYCGGVILALAWLALSAAQAQTTNYALGATALLVGPAAGSNSVVLAVTPPSGAWTATTNAAWLHLSLANQSGAGSTNVIFSYDANPGATRSGTLTIAGETLGVTQAGSTYVAAEPMTRLVTSESVEPHGVAVNAAGNVYMACTVENTISLWTATNDDVTTLVGGLNYPFDVALDGAGNVYIADSYNFFIREWTVANNALITLVSSGLSFPYGVAVDSAGNVYIADSGNDAIKEWTAANSNVITLVSSGLSYPYGVAVDRAGNVYIADTDNNAIKEWQVANDLLSTLVSSNLNQPFGVAVDGSGNVYIADTYNGAIKEWTAANNTVTTLVPSSAGLPYPSGVALDGAGNLYIGDSIAGNALNEVPHAFVNPNARFESPFAGTDALPVVLPATANLTGPFIPTSDESWLTIGEITNGVASFSFLFNNSSNRTANITLLGQMIPVTQLGPVYSLGNANFLAGPSAGSNSVVLAVNPNFGIWTAMANTSWLHLDAADQSGTGSTNLIFTYDANPGSTRSGTITVAGQTLTVTQAGSTYVAAGPLTSLVSSNLSNPMGVAVDSKGNVYIANTGSNAIVEWQPSINTLTTLVSGLSGPFGVAVDGAGNVYFSDTGSDAVKEWSSSNGNVITLVSGLNSPAGVAVDRAGNVYIADTGNNAVKEWSAANGNVTNLVPELSGPFGVAVDEAGNIYISESGNNAVVEWSAANSQLTTLASGLNGPSGVAVDGGGNVCIANTRNNTIQEWSVAAGIATPLVVSGLNAPSGVAIDDEGNLYIADSGNGAIRELPYAFVDPTPNFERADAGNVALPVVLPITENLLPPFAPTSSAPTWLTISGITNGVVSFSLTANLGSSRNAYLTLLGQTISVSQGGLAYAIGTSALLLGPTPGSNTVVLGVTPQVATWTNTANASWLHLSPAIQSGAGSTNVLFTYDGNPGPMRSGSLTIVGQTVAVTQAASNYVAATTVGTLVSSGLNNPFGIAVDSGGNIYIADTGDSAVKEWMAATGDVIPLVSANLSSPGGVAVDKAGNVYIADTGDSAIKQWMVADSNVITLVSSGLSSPEGVAVDGAGNVYIADSSDGAAKEWTALNSNLTTLVSGLSTPYSLALDAAGNVYVADTDSGSGIVKWTAANNTSVDLAGGPAPYGVAVDGSGNVYIADVGGEIQKWTAANGDLTTIASSGLNSTHGVAVDGAGNVYISDTGNNAIKVLPYVFLNPTPRLEGLAAGTDSLPAVVPAAANLLAPFTPSSDQPWLTITGITNGVVNFAFTATTSNRTGNITLLGETIPITQGGPTYSIGATALLVGPAAGSNSVVLAVTPPTGVWTATTNATWLHLSLANQSGAGSTNVIFSYDVNPGPTRSGTLTVAGQTLTVTQAGSTYVAAQQVTTVVSSGLYTPFGVAVDSADNVYINDSSLGEILEWTTASGDVTTLITKLFNTYGVALDNAGNVYIANTGAGAIDEFPVPNYNFGTLVTGLDSPYGVALDKAGNVYIANTGAGAIDKWTAANSSLTTLVSSGLSTPEGVAVDVAGNAYIADTGNNAIKEWTAADGATNTLVSSGLKVPRGVAVDGAGNVYIANSGGASGGALGGAAIKKWTAADGTMNALVATGLEDPRGVAVDGAGNVYMSDFRNGVVKELPYAFVDPTPKLEGLAAGNDALPGVLPATENLLAPFAPTTDQPWLTISGITNDVVSFSFTYNPGSNRMAHISLLGQSIPVTQTGAGVTPPILTGAQMLGNGVIQFAFTNTPGASFTVLTTTNLSLPLSNWTVVGTASNTASGMFQFTSQPTTNDGQRFYSVRSP